MSSYAVVWRDEGGDDSPQAGRLEFDRYGFALHGRDRREYITAAALDEVANDRRATIGPCPALRVRTRDGRSLLLAAFSGAGILVELHERLAALLVPAA